MLGRESKQRKGRLGYARASQEASQNFNGKMSLQVRHGGFHVVQKETWAHDA